jgi:hypothetical protein
MAGLAATAGFDQIVSFLDSLAVAAGTDPTAGQCERTSMAEDAFRPLVERVEKPAD